MNKKSNPIEEALTTAIAFCFASILVFATVLATKVLWPTLRFVAKQAWALIRKACNASKDVSRGAKTNELPTPKIFKGALNLAPAKQMHF
jgi:hypothetical protein